MKAAGKSKGGRPRAFGVDAALEAAMRTFWAHGYEATSIAMLRAAMGLTQPQIYNAFVDKETLFRRALDRYLDLEAGFAMAALSAPVSSREAISKLLNGAAEAYAALDKPGGCLFVTGALASSPQAAAIADELRTRRKATEAAIAQRLSIGQIDGDVPAGADIASLARFVTGVIHGMSIQARDGATVEDLRGLAETALAAWPGDQPKRKAAKPQNRKLRSASLAK